MCPFRIVKYYDPDYKRRVYRLERKQGNSWELIAIDPQGDKLHIWIQVYGIPLENVIDC